MANDFHFTIHVGLLVTAFNEYWAMTYYKTAILSLLVCIFQTVMVLSLRGAYIIDIFGAVCFGHFFWIAGMWLSYYIDVKILGLPFQERFPEFPKQCGNCKTPINCWTNNTLAEIKNQR